MRKTCILSALCLLIGNNFLSGQTLPAKNEILDALKLVNESWIQTNPDPGNNQWARAAYFTGNMDFYKVYPKASYFKYANLWSEQNGWGLSGGVTTRNADNQIAGQTYIDLYLMDDGKTDTKIEAISQSINYMVAGNKKDDWWWIDALYMAMPVFARLGVLYADDAYFNKMYDLYAHTKYTRELYNNETGLWYRDESFKPPYTTPNGMDSYWSRGNGWVFGAHVRVLQLLPETDVHREEYITTFQQMAGALKDCQREDGFWNASLADADDYGGPETSGTSFFTYGMAWGINNEILDSATYYPVIVKAWEGLTSTAVHEDGFLGYVQGVGTNPASSQPVTLNSTADFGVGAFLLAGTELLKMAQGEITMPSNFYTDSVIVIDDTHIQICFNDTIDTSTGINPSNYSITNININNITITDDPTSIILTTDALSAGLYQLTVQNIRNDSGEPVERETIQFLYTENIKIDASSFEQGTSNTAEKTLDFDFDTRWSAEGNGEWIMYDLQDIKTVQSVAIAFYKGDERKAYFSIALSEDSTEFTEVFNGESDGTSLDLQNFDFEDADARYIKITGYGNSQSQWNSFTEVRINSKAIVSNADELAIADNELNIFPNPYQSGNLTVINPFEDQDVTVFINDICGKKVYHADLKSGNQLIFIASGITDNVPKGIYTVSVSNGKLSISKRLIIK